MNTELEVLKNIFKAKNEVSVKLISNHLGFGADYIRFICKKLEEKDLVKAFGRDWYKITSRGQKGLERMGLISRTLRKREFKIENPIWEHVQIPSAQGERLPKVIELKSEFKESKAEKLKLGKKIEKAAIFLKKIIS